VCYEWDVSKVGDMSLMLFQASHFNQVRVRVRVRVWVNVRVTCAMSGT